MTSKINEAAEKAAQVPLPKRRRVPVWLWVAGPLAVAGLFGWEYIASQREVSTDNAYIKAERILIAPQVGGRVVEVAVQQNQPVKKGDLLFRIDADPLMESFHRGVILCYAKTGRRAEALSAYRRLRQTLSVMLGIQPSAASQALYDSLYSD